MCTEVVAAVMGKGRVMGSGRVVVVAAALLVRKAVSSDFAGVAMG